jgi:holin-like protein
MKNALNAAAGLAGLALALLLAEAVKNALGLAVPEPVLAVMGLVIFFMLRRGVPSGIRRVAEILLPHMALFFIPALVGVMALSDLLAQIIAPLVLIIIVSTIVPLWFTAWAFQKFAPPLEEKEVPHADE